jgi:hypothetical protein
LGRRCRRARNGAVCGGRSWGPRVRPEGEGGSRMTERLSRVWVFGVLEERYGSERVARDREEGGGRRA